MTKTRDLANLADLNFDSGTMVVDKTNDRVGIGTASPDFKVEIVGGTNNGLHIKDAESATVFGGLFTQSANLALVARSNHALTLGTNDAERMRIDSSGNLLVGTTDTVPSNNGAGGDAGLAFTPDGAIRAARSGNVSLDINRMDSDGDIAAFRKDGTTVGSIGTNSSALTVGTSDTGVVFFDSIDSIAPLNISTNSGRDAAINLGASFLRFKDLYLSGGVYLGGTGSANYLDDYEEGTWVPTVEGSTTNPSGLSYSIQDGTYTKMGRMVYVAFRVRFSFTGGTGAGNLVIAGLSFTAANYAQPKSPPQHDNLSFTGFEYIEMSANANTATIGLAKNRSASTASSLALSDCNAGSTDINGGLFYFIA